MNTWNISNISRRTALRHLSFLACAIPVSIAVTTGVSEAQGKTPKLQANYRDKPNGTKQCSGCVNFISDNGCTIVEGNISPQGWCTFWKRKQ